MEGYCESCNKWELIPFSTIFNVVLATVREITFKDIRKPSHGEY